VGWYITIFFLVLAQDDTPQKTLSHTYKRGRILSSFWTILSIGGRKRQTLERAALLGESYFACLQA
jgi:hypothetical protein